MSEPASTPSALWITGPARSGKTAQLIELFQTWVQRPAANPAAQSPSLLLFAATGDNRLSLVERLTEATQGEYPIRSSTPLAFFETEVMLFWPLLVERLQLSPQFPLRLRPETEQALARSLWQPLLEDGSPLAQEGISPDRMVRRILDIHLLAASGNLPAEAIGPRLKAGMASALGSEPLWQAMGEALLQWRQWCLQRGLLTYGILTELYGQQLLPDPNYQQQFLHRYDGLLADDVDEYPALAQGLFSFALDQGCPTALSYNPNGSTRLGFGADPEALATLASRCEIIELEPAADSLEPRYGEAVLGLIQQGTGFEQQTNVSSSKHYGMESSSRSLDLQDFWEGPFHGLETVSRAQLLRAIADEIIQGIHSGQITPAEVAILGPGVDPIARYSLMEILRQQNIPLNPLLEQRPLSSSPMVRALLTLLAFIYPGLGQLVGVDQVAEMLVVLSLAATPTTSPAGTHPTATHPATTHPTAKSEDAPPQEAASRTEQDRESDQQAGEGIPNSDNRVHSSRDRAQPQIDAVRAGLLADHCYRPNPDLPDLLPVETFPRWDRLGYRATASYQHLRQWINNQRLQQQQRLTLTPVVVLDRAIQTFLWNGSLLTYDQLAALRELMEAAQHFWQVEARLGQIKSQSGPSNAPLNSIARFIQLLRSGAVTANPYPAKPLETQPGAVTLATIFQYRISRPQHRWLFWLDASSSLWITTGTGLFGAGVFLQSATPRQTSADALRLAEARLEQSLRNLLGRATERIYLCASELSTSGQPQMGPMLPLVEMASAMQPKAEQSSASPGPAAPLIPEAIPEPPISP